MSTETYTTLIIIALCWVILSIADVLICALLRIVAGVNFGKAFLWGLISFSIPIIAIGYGTFIGRNIFTVTEVEIQFKSLPENFDGYRIVHISDIHSRSFAGREKQLEKAVNKINALSADLIAFTGDLITLTPKEIETISPVLSRMEAKDGICSVLGNHDYCIYADVDQDTKAKYLEELIDEETSIGWDLLNDRNRIIRRGEDSIAVIGVQNTSPSRHFPSRGDLAKASEGTEGAFRIVLSHDPMHWESEILANDYPLTLSGHTHAMQLSLMGWSPSRIIFPQYRGLYSQTGKCGEDPQHLYVNIGLGETIFPARIGAHPEITLITLRKAI